ncbi:phage tail protein, partial [uncultured Escherichia sp.]
MTSKYYAILTSQGAARLANATMLGSKLNLTQMAVGDANGILPTPDPTQTRLINQKRIAPLNMLDIDPSNPGQIIAEQIIPENEGGFWIREIGLYDDEGILIAVANCPETYKPRLQEGSGRTQTIRMLLIVSNTESVTLKIDPSVVLATRKYVDDRMSGASLQLDKLIEKHINAEDPHTQYAHKESPAFSGTPTAPTADKADNSNKLATTK